MARHLSFRSGNPTLNKNTFSGMSATRSRGPIIKDNVMTIEGTVNKTALSLLLSVIMHIHHLWVLIYGLVLYLD